MLKESKNISGFTLLEILIALAISTLILAAVFGVFNNSQLSYLIQEDVAAMQQDVRVAKIWIERDMRMAGAGLKDYPDLTTLGPDGKSPFTFKNGGGVNGTDELIIRYVMPNPKPCGDPPAGAGGAIPCDSLPLLSLSDKFLPTKAAVAEVKQDLNFPPFDVWYKKNCYCRDEVYTHPQPDYEVLITSPDGSRSDVVVVTQVLPGPPGQNMSTLQNHPLDGQMNKIFNEYPEGSTISFLSLLPIEVIRYFIDSDGVLRREDLGNGGGAQPIAENIEDLQFAFGLDTDDDGIVDDWLGDDSADSFDGDGDISDADKDLIRAVRINILGRTKMPRKQLGQSKRPKLEDHNMATASDYFRRRLSSVTVELRNIN